MSRSDYTEYFENCWQVSTGEIARYEQFLLFPLCFQKTVLQTRKNQGFWERVKLKRVSYTIHGRNNF